MYQEDFDEDDVLDRIDREQMVQRVMKNMTPRQRQIATMLAEGYSNQEIADELNISKQAVGQHVQTIKEKFEVEKILHDKDGE